MAFPEVCPTLYKSGVTADQLLQVSADSDPETFEFKEYSLCEQWSCN